MRGVTLSNSLFYISPLHSLTAAMAPGTPGLSPLWLFKSQSIHMPLIAFAYEAKSGLENSAFVSYKPDLQCFFYAEVIEKVPGLSLFFFNHTVMSKTVEMTE